MFEKSDHVSDIEISFLASSTSKSHREKFSSPSWRVSAPEAGGMVKAFAWKLSSHRTLPERCPELVAVILSNRKQKEIDTG